MESIIKVKGFKRSIEMNLIQGRYRYISADKREDFSQKKYEETFLSASTITNASINLNANIFFENSDKLFDSLQHLLCKHVVIFFNEKITVSNLKKLIELINRYNIHECLIISEFSEAMYSDEMAEIALTSNRYKAIVFYNSPFVKNLEDIIFFVKDISLISDKRQNEFIANYNLYLESLNFHTYFNRKLHIGSNGEIKNAIEGEDTFGFLQNINDAKELVDIIKSKKFQKYWNLKKDVFDICCDCEFRYMCVDNRTPISRGNGKWYHETDCNYNPFISKWLGEMGYLTLEACGVKSDKNEYSIDYNKLELINKKLK